MIAYRKVEQCNRAAQGLLAGLRRILTPVLVAGVLAAPAIAQVQTVTAPVFPAVDARGVDAVTGAYWSSAAEVVIGRPGEGGLVHGRTWIGSGWRDWLAGTISSSGSKYSVSVGAKTETFTLSAGVYDSDQRVGSTLTYSSATNKYIYTTSDGAEYVFNKALATAGSTTNFWSSNEGAIETIARSGGVRLFYYYTSASAGGQTAIRPKTILNNLGYQIFFTYAIDAPTTAAEVTGGYLSRTKATGYNRAYFFCSNMGNSCATSTGGDWPYVDYTNSGTNEYVTDRLNQQTRYAFATNARTQFWGVFSPTATSGATVGYFTTGAHTGKVSSTVSTSSGVGTWSYAYSDANGVRTTTATSPSASVTVTQSAIASGWTTEVWANIAGTRKTILGRDAYGRVTRVTSADNDALTTDGYVEYTYDARGNATQTTTVPKSSTPALANITTYASYDSSCTNVLTCNQPNTTTDARGYVTTYTYSSTHGGLLTITSPNPAGGAPGTSGVRPQTRFIYTSLNAYYRDSSGAFVPGWNVYKLSGQSSCMTGSPAGSGVGCASSADETKMTITYGATNVANNLLPVSITQASGDGVLSVQMAAITYTAQGDVASIDGPVAGAGDMTTFYYDAVRQIRATAIPTPSGASYRINRVTYNADGQVTLSEFGIYGTPASWTPTSWSSMMPLEKMTTQYSNVALPVLRKTEARPNTGASFQTFSIVEQGYDADFRTDCSALRMNPSLYASATPSSNVCSHWVAGAYGPDRIASPDFNAFNEAFKMTSGINTPLQRDDVTRTYTPMGLLQTQADAKGNTTTYSYDAFDRLVQTRYPGSSSDCTGVSRDCIEITYDDYGRMIGKTGRDGLSFGYTYDNLGRIITYTPPSGQPAVTYTYDNLGRVTQAIMSGNTTKYTYDALNNLTSETQGFGGAPDAGKKVEYVYEAGRRTQMKWPDGYLVTYQYTATGELLTIKENDSLTLATFAYDDLGRRTSLTRANGSITVYNYDGISRLTDLDLNLGGSATTNDLQVDLAYNPASQIVGRTVSNNSYLPSAPSVYTDHYATNALNQYATITGVSPNPTYDKRGNMTNDGTKAYEYDYDNKLTKAGTTDLIYDPSGRLYQVAGSSPRRFLYDGVDIIAELDATTGNVLRRYVHGPGVDEPLVRYDGAGTGTKSQLYADEHGSIIATEGASTNLNKYNEYGVPAGSQSDLFQYTGQAWIPEAGLYYYKARFYNPEIGRFMQTDPIGYAGGTNLYKYVGSDPVNKTDSFGLVCAEDDPGCVFIHGDPWDPFVEWGPAINVFNPMTVWPGVQTSSGVDPAPPGADMCYAPSVIDFESIGGGRNQVNFPNLFGTNGGADITVKYLYPSQVYVHPVILEFSPAKGLNAPNGFLTDGIHSPGPGGVNEFYSATGVVTGGRVGGAAIHFANTATGQKYSAYVDFYQGSANSLIGRLPIPKGLYNVRATYQIPADGPPVSINVCGTLPQ